MNNFVYSRSFHAHKHVRDNLLEIIDKFKLEHLDTPEGDSISKTDWLKDEQIPYRNEMAIHFSDHLTKVFSYSRIQILQIWFQQYTLNDIHNWHVHERSHFTNVYFLELPDKKFKTEIKDFNGNVIDYEAEEGYILSFPGFLPHRSPKINQPARKTILSFNATLC